MKRDKAIVICSGGLDSTTAATHAVKVDNCDVLLLHFKYKCLAEKNEIKAIKNITRILNVECRFYEFDWLKNIGRSKLFDRNEDISDSIKGAEYPHEWVPARNFLFMAFAFSLCDAMNVKRIYMGLNLEEGAVYPDNTVEFFERLNDISPFATISRPKIYMPLARMMKWQIVEYAYKIKAPISYSWSCYKNEKYHCGVCGPCYMRKTAHKMLKLGDSVNYLQ